MRIITNYHSILTRFLLLFLCVFFFSAISGYSQPESHYESIIYEDIFSGKSSYGINLSGLTTGSGLGLNLNPAFYYRYKKNSVAVAPNFQSGRVRLSGIQGHLQREMDYTFKQFALYYQMNLIYHYNARLGPTSSDQYLNIYGHVSEFNYNAFEHYYGLGGRKTLAEHISFDASLGIGGYHILNAADMPHKVPFKSDEDLSLMLKIGLTYNFK